MRIGVLAIQGDFAAHARAIARLGAEAVEVRRAEALGAVDALVIPGGETTTLLRLLRAFDLWEPLRRFPERGRPLFGTCAGLILLARRVSNPEQDSLGLLDVDVRRNGYGRQIDSFVAHGRLRVPDDLQLPPGVPCQDTPVHFHSAGDRSWSRCGEDAAEAGSATTVAPPTSAAFAPTVAEFETEFVFIRAPVITRHGPQVEVLATCEGLPVLVRQGGILAASFHPELSREGLAEGIFISMVAEARR